MRKLLLMLFSIAMLSSHLFAQTRTITGKITDSKGLPMANASIVVKGTVATGTTTKEDGTFSLTVPTNTKALIISGVGYSEQEINIGNKEIVEVSLSANNKDLQEVVVVAYGTQKKANLTGSVVTIKGGDIENKPFTSIDKALQGQVAGLQSVAASGAPGANQFIRIRGISSITASNAPLWVIDGVPVNANDVSRLTTTANLLATMNPNDIENVTVLKDAASASIYGSRAANGVILVTTRKGRSGKTRFRFDTEVGQSDIAYENPRYKSLNAADYFTITREGLINSGNTNPDPTLASLGYGNGIDYNWLEGTTQKGTQQQYNLSASGGNEKTTFYLSGGYFKQDGTTLATGLDRYNGAVRVNHKATESLSFGMNINGGYIQQNTPLAGGAFGNPVLNSYFVLPSRAPYKADGTPNINTTDFPNGGTFNTIALVDMDKRELRNLSLRGSVYGEYKILKNLSFKSVFGIDYNTLEEDQFNNPIYGDGYKADATDPTPAPFKRPDPATSGRSYSYYTRIMNSVWTNTLDFQQDITKDGALSINAQAGYESQISKQYQNSVQSQGFPLNPLLIVPSIGATPITSAATITQYSFVSQFISANINFKDKFVVSGSFRRDGSSRFSVNNKYGNFWAVGGTYNLDKEDFMENISFISQLKLRASYGVNGNAGIGNYDWIPTYSFGTNYNNAPGSIPSNVGDSSLTWELNKPFNVGIDVSFFKNRLNLTADYYERESSDLLLNVPVSRTSGFISATRNLGAMTNKGVEISINAIPVQIKDFTWTIDLNFAYNQNRVTELPGGKDIISPTSTAFLLRPGYDVQTFYVREYAGVDPANGDPLWYLDSTKKSTTNNYTAAQRVMYGSASPKYFGSFTNSFRFKGFSLEAQFYYNFGNYVQDAWGGYYNGAGFGATFNKIQRVMERWQKPGDITDQPKYIANGNKSFNSLSSFYLAKGDFIRLRNLQVGYELPRNVLSKLHMTNAFFYIRGTNLWTWVKDDNLGFDPEQGVSSQTNLDVFIPKTMTIGLNLGF